LPKAAFHLQSAGSAAKNVEVAMTRVARTAQELADMIALRMNLQRVAIEVHGDALGWHVFALASVPNTVSQVQIFADSIADDLRITYDLPDDLGA